jgi:hypothetical protein
MAAKGFADRCGLCEWLLETAGVAIVPGRAFGLPGHARLSFAYADADLTQAHRRVLPRRWKGGADPWIAARSFTTISCAGSPRATCPQGRAPAGPLSPELAVSGFPRGLPDPGAGPAKPGDAAGGAGVLHHRLVGA